MRAPDASCVKSLPRVSWYAEVGTALREGLEIPFLLSRERCEFCYCAAAEVRGKAIVGTSHVSSCCAVRVRLRLRFEQSQLQSAYSQANRRTDILFNQQSLPCEVASLEDALRCFLLRKDGCFTRHFDVCVHIGSNKNVSNPYGRALLRYTLCVGLPFVLDSDHRKMGQVWVCRGRDVVGRRT